MGALNLFIGSGKVGLSTEPRIYRHNEQEIEIAHYLFGVRERRPGVQRQAGHHALLFYRIELALDMDRRFRVEREHGGPSGSERFDVVLRLDHHQVNVDRLVRELAQRLDHVGPERDVRYEPPIHDVHVQPVGARLQDLLDLLRQPREIGREHAGCDTDAVRRHCGLLATTMSTTVPGAASVPAAGRWPHPAPWWTRSEEHTSELQSLR